MARWLSNWTAVRHGWKSGSLYLFVMAVLLAAVVFLLFRGRSPGPQQADAETPAPQTAAVGMPDPVAVVSQPIVETGTNAQPAASPVVSPATIPQTQLPVQPQPAAGPTDTPNPQAETAIAEALSMIQSQPASVIEVRNRLNKVLLMPLGAQQRETVKVEMAKLADKWLWGPAAFPSDTLCDTYTVRSGDLLDIIGRRLKVPYEVLMQINNIPRPQALQAGKAMKVVKGPFHVKVCRTTFTMDLYLQDTYVRSFKVGLGRPGYETPTGRWRVQDGGKLIQPTWTDPDSGRVYKANDPDYPLGTRWIALEGLEGAAVGRTGFAIHGTKDPEQIGTAGSRGCIRMYNGEVVLMYNLLVPVYSQVDVFDN